VSYATICISRDAGADGELVGRLVADALGYRYLDEEIVAHAASYTLGRDAGALRVLVTASPETRASRMADGLAAPEKAVRDADRARAHYLKSFYDVSQELPAHYDLVINTDSLTAAQAAGVISALARPA
jgi:cytidylate kinase